MPQTADMDLKKEMDDLDFGGAPTEELAELDHTSETPATVETPEPEKKDVEAQESVTPEEGKEETQPEETQVKEPEADKEAPATEDVKKHREQIENLNGALREERNMRKRAQDEARRAAALRQQAPVQPAPEAVPPHGQENNESDIDPDVDRTVNRIVAPHITKLEQTIRLNRYQLDEIRVSQEYGAHEFREASAAFAEMINPESATFDPGMLKAFQESDRPALLAFNMGRARSIDTMLERARNAGKDEGRQSVMDELKNKGKTIPSLSSVGGSSAQSSASGMRKELDEL